MSVRRILTVQDISCVGQCSMTVALPVLSACGHETCVLPTLLLSTHTGGFGTPEIVRFSDRLEPIIAHWKEKHITFDAVLTGYLGSIQAIDAAAEILNTLLVPGGVAIVDPAMADNGKLYSGFDGAYVEKMKCLCRKADMVLPNLTEAALLAGLPWEDRADEAYAEKLLSGLNFPRVLVTGVGEQTSGFLLKDGERMHRYTHPRFPGSFSGTGDLFAAAFTGLLLTGKTVYDSACCAANFTCKAIARTAAHRTHWYGIQFEPVLPELMAMCRREAET